MIKLSIVRIFRGLTTEGSEKLSIVRIFRGLTTEGSEKLSIVRIFRGLTTEGSEKVAIVSPKKLVFRKNKGGSSKNFPN